MGPFRTRTCAEAASRTSSSRQQVDRDSGGEVGSGQQVAPCGISSHAKIGAVSTSGAQAGGGAGGGE